MILWLVALPAFLIISSVYKIVIIMSLDVPATVCLLILGSLWAVIIAQWTQWSPDFKIWNHSTSVHNWRFWQQSVWNCGLYCASAEVSDFVVYQLHVKGIVLYYWSSLRCIKSWIVTYYRGLKFPHIAPILLVLESDGACRIKMASQQEKVQCWFYWRVADKSLAQPGMKQATATENFEFHISCL
jgi:hypothetical protein